MCSYAEVRLTNYTMHMRKLSVLLLLIVACRSAQMPSSSALPAAVVDQMFESYFEEYLDLNPTTATSIGETRLNNRLAISISDEHRSKERVFREKYLRAAQAIDRNALPSDRQLSLDLFIAQQKEGLDLLRFPSHLAPINQFYNFGAFFAQLGSGTGIHPFKTVRDYDDFLSRSQDFTKWVDVAIANMERGIAQGIVQPRVLVAKAIPQLEAQIVDDVEKSLFWQPIVKMPSDFSASDRDRLTRAYRETISATILPAYRKLTAYLRDRYLPNSRTTVGLSALPGGSEWYAALVRSTTTTTLTPEEVHRIGLSEVARIQAEMEEVKKRARFEGDLTAFFTFLQNDSQFYYETTDELLKGYQDLQARIDASTDRLFDVKPKANYEIRKVEPFRERSAASGSYQAASADGSRPGIFYLNTYDVKARPKFAMESLLLHEGSPGHHFQISIQRELEGLPRFRRFGGYTAYTEGWGLYSESIGKELGFYADPYSDYGRLDAELWRAIRLVLDTGMHARGWTREAAIEYALKNSSVGETRAVSEVERFLAIPSQALAYKIGQLKITEVRRRAEQKLGSRFDVKAFHRTVLESGSLPLEILENRIDQWIANQ